MLLVTKRARPSLPVPLLRAAYVALLLLLPLLLLLLLLLLRVQGGQLAVVGLLEVKAAGRLHGREGGESRAGQVREGRVG